MMGNENAESAVIGCILMDGGTVMPEAVLSIGPEDFSRAEYRAIYRACLSLFEESRDIDVVTLREALSVAGVDANACMAVAVTAQKYNNNQGYQRNACHFLSGSSGISPHILFRMKGNI